MAFIGHEFSASVAQLWAALIDPTTYPQWLIGAQKIRDVDDTWPAVDAAFHHREETIYFPKVRSEIGRKALDDLGETMSEAKAHAPTHPHPRSPQTPPGDLAAGSVAGAVDRVTDTVSGVAQGGLAAAVDLVDRFRGKKTALRSPRIEYRPQHRSKSRTNEQALDQAIEAVRSATLTGAQKPTQVRSKTRKTLAAAKTGAKRTAGSARKATRRTATTAKQAATTTNAAKANSKTRTTTAAAKTGAKRTAGSARKATRRTATTAKQAATTTAHAAKAS